ncbi:hypothetical protein FRC02_008963 [Tulasnella sp. 418]|nr:hypothetical protein FRC02_008963 [Tulasnella sp. 418]
MTETKYEGTTSQKAGSQKDMEVLGKRYYSLTSTTPHRPPSQSSMPLNYETIYVVGPSSAGKTTLCNALEKQIPVKAYIKEVARTVMRDRGFSRSDVGEGGKIEMQYAIMHAQLEAEGKARQRPGDETTWPYSWTKKPTASDDVVLCDRSALDPIVYVGWCVSNELKTQTRKKMLDDEEFQKVLPTYQKSLFVLLHPVEEWVVDDGVRSLEQRGLFNQELMELLSELKIPFKEIGPEVKDLQERVKLVQGWLGLKGLEAGKRAGLLGWWARLRSGD